jgi:putative flippase GtrA
MITRYFFIQVFIFFLNIFIFTILVHHTKTNIQVANIIGHLSSGIIAVPLHRIYTFTDAKKSQLSFQYIKYIFNAFIFISLSCFVLYLISHLIPQKIISKLISDGIMFFYSFYISKYIIFR